MVDELIATVLVTAASRMYPLGGNDRRGDGPHPAAVCVGIRALSATGRATAPCATRGSHAADHGGRDVARYARGTADRNVTYRLATQSQDCVRPSRAQSKRNGRDPRRSREFACVAKRCCISSTIARCSNARSSIQIQAFAISRAFTCAVRKSISPLAIAKQPPMRTSSRSMRSA